MNIQIRIWLLNLALSIYALDPGRSIRMLAHFHVGWHAKQYGFVWFRSDEDAANAVFGSTFKWLRPRPITDDPRIQVVPPSKIARL